MFASMRFFFVAACCTASQQITLFDHHSNPCPQPTTANIDVAYVFRRNGAVYVQQHACRLNSSSLQATMNARSLHYVFRTTNRQKAYDFYVKKLGMKILRHEEFGEGCKASCNGPFDGKWSKTMIGYGPEDDNFVFELTYNYGLKKVTQGNDFGAIVVETTLDLENTTDPDGYKFIFEKVEPLPKNPVNKVVLHVSDLEKSIEFWGNILGLAVNVTKKGERAVIGFGTGQTALELVSIHEAVKRENASGRIAFSVAQRELKPLEAKVREFDEKRILTPYTDLDTPGKETVSVVILADPDGHEICFVGDENFRKLSQPDPKADELLQKAIKDDWSDEWEASNSK